ncbi:hypothetical protein C8R48DRAFT_768767 [Suillus tomentosus]|nr:hypothetical protein C8R48DRAFT_768767 [Suillus tomentosus]
MTADGRRSGSRQFFFRVLSLYHETKVAKPGKQEPDYNFVLPHKDPLKCPIGGPAISLHYQFDQEGLMSKVHGWDWSRSSTWREVKLMFGKHVRQPSSGDTLWKMYTTMLGPTTITSKKKLHLACHTMPSMMEDMGVHADEVDAIGHWEGNTPCETYAAKIPKSAVCALAGFYIGEQYSVPWATTDVPAELQMQIFPFIEDALANLCQAHSTNYGTINFLELLQLLRDYFWWVIAAIHESFPDSALLKWLQVIQSSEAKMFLQQWPRAREALEATAQSDLAISSSFGEAATQSAFVSLANSQRQLDTTINTVLSHCNWLLRRTEPLSPSKNHDGARFLPVAASSVGCGTMHTAGPDVWPPMAQGDTCQHPPPPLSQTNKHRACTAEELTPTLHLQPSMNPAIVVRDGRSFHVFPLSPAMPPNFHSGHDLIIPSAKAFCDPITASVPQFPQFMAHKCSWSSIFEMVKQPSLLWACWHPRNLGEYHTIKQLWAAWHEGTIIDGVGQMSPLQLIEQEWGGTKDRSTRKGHHQAWQPHNDNNVSSLCFLHFHSHLRLCSSNHASEAVQILDEQCGSMSVPQFHSKLQLKKKRTQAPAASTNA